MKKRNRIDKILELPPEVYSKEPKIILTGFKELIFRKLQRNFRI